MGKCWGKWLGSFLNSFFLAVTVGCIRLPSHCADANAGMTLICRFSLPWPGHVGVDWLFLGCQGCERPGPPLTDRAGEFTPEIATRGPATSDSWTTTGAQRLSQVGHYKPLGIPRDGVSWCLPDLVANLLSFIHAALAVDYYGDDLHRRLEGAWCILVVLRRCFRFPLPPSKQLGSAGEDAQSNKRGGSISDLFPLGPGTVVEDAGFRP